MPIKFLLGPTLGALIVSMKNPDIGESKVLLISALTAHKYFKPDPAALFSKVIESNLIIAGETFEETDASLNPMDT
jgi:hypothetical protein